MSNKNSLSDKKVMKVFSDPARLNQTLQSGIHTALLRHKQAGNFVCEWKDNKVVWVPPELILVKQRNTTDGD